MTHVKRMVMQGFKSFAPKTEIVFDKGINTIVGPNGSGKSARWDTRILLTSGEIKPIGEIVEESLEKASIRNNLDDGVLTFENPLNIGVLGLDQRSMKIKECSVKAFIKRDGEPNLYTIRTRTGKDVTTTSCHPVLVYRDGEIKSEIVQNLRENELIATPNNLNFPEKIIPINIDGLNVSSDNLLEISRMLGYLVGDGSIIKNKRVDFINADLEIINDYEKILSKLNLKIKRSNRKFSKAKTIYFNSRKISNGFVKFFKNNYKKEGKHIPREILFSTKEVLSNFLGALFDCDASVSKDNPSFEYVTMSERLANEVILSLLRFGIVARKTKKKKCASNTLLKLRKDYYHVTIEGKDKISKLYQNISLKCYHKKSLLEKWTLNPTITNVNIDILPREVNYKIKELVKLTGIKYKSLRKKYPLLAAYIENRCAPTRQGIARLMPLFEKKLQKITESHSDLGRNVHTLVSTMNELYISGQEASCQIGLHKSTIQNNWASEKFQPKPQNLEKFYWFIKGILVERIPNIVSIINLLRTLSTSDIFWDKIIKIDKIEGEDYVYDLEIEDTHNFIGNEVFVHNSNISDALCFVLGRLSAKSMRAAKSGNLLFMGSKSAKPSKEASVEIVFDNSKKTFNLPDEEVLIKRAVRHSGQSIYKLNGETKTRGEIIEALAQAGIDPYGFNIILQGNIHGFVKMHPEERRKIIEEVAGISIYEARKEKSLKELEKTDSRLKEISTVLRERTSFLRNLESERAQALKFKELETTIKKCKASILTRRKQDKQKEIDSVRNSIESKLTQKNNLKSQADTLQEKINSFNSRIEKINQHIQQSSGLEQDTLHESIANLKAELEGLKVRKENYENRREEIENRIVQLESSIPEYESEIKSLKTKSPLMAKKQEGLKKKKQELADIEEQRQNAYKIKTGLNSIKEKIKDKENNLSRNDAESDSILKQIEEITRELSYKNITSCKKAIKDTELKIQSIKTELEALRESETSINKKISIAESQIVSAENIKQKINEIDICPLCQNKMTKEHITHVNKDSDSRIFEAKKTTQQAEKEISAIKSEINSAKNNLSNSEKKIIETERELSSHRMITDKQEYLKKLMEESGILREELKNFEAKRSLFEKKAADISSIEEKYSSKLLEIEEISSRTEKDLDTTLLYKERELEKFREAIKQSGKNIDEINSDIDEISESIENKNMLLQKKEGEEEALNEKFQNLFKEREGIQEQIQRESYSLSTVQAEVKQVEEQVNYLKIGNAKLDAEREALDMELKDFSGTELLKGSFNFLQEKLQKSQESINRIGSINMRALEVYDEVKEEYDKVQERVNTLESEKNDILSIIEEIDRKKKKTFMKTYKGVNELFSKNFSQLSAKGQATLEIENSEDLFSGGINIAIKMGKGKYFDVTSLSGGEQTLVALSLLFAIQEHKPYHFYIFDEIDAALDKRNSERLSLLLKKYMQNGQYIVVTHNDAIISDSNFLYGVSMHEGISKILSLKMD